MMIGQKVGTGRELIWRVCMSACAISRSGAGLGSQREVKCSPIDASL